MSPRQGCCRWPHVAPRTTGLRSIGLQLGMVVILLLALCPVAIGQVKPAAIGGEEQFAVGGMLSAYHLDYGKHWLGGAGVYLDANINWRFGVEAEARWLWVHQKADTHEATYLAGPRYTFNAIGKFRPYAKLLIGEGTFNFPYNYARGNYFVLAPGGGIDYRISHRIRLRLIDAEYQSWPQFTFGSTSSYGLSTGVRYAFY